MGDIFWAMKNLDSPTGFFTGTYITKQDAIESAEVKYGKSWELLYRNGYRIVKVKLVEKEV